MFSAFIVLTMKSNGFIAKALITLHQGKWENSPMRKSQTPSSHGASKLPPLPHRGLWHRKGGSKRHCMEKLLGEYDPYTTISKKVNGKLFSPPMDLTVIYWMQPIKDSRKPFLLERPPMVITYPQKTNLKWKSKMTAKYFVGPTHESTEKNYLLTFLFKDFP